MTGLPLVARSSTTTADPMGHIWIRHSRAGWSSRQSSVSASEEYCRCGRRTCTRPPPARFQSLLKRVWVGAAPVLCLHSRGTASRSTRQASGSHRRDARSPAALLLMPSTGPFVIFVSRYARMPSACFRIVRPSFTNGVRRDRAAHSSHSSRSAGEARGSALLLAADGGCGHPGRGDPARRQADEGAPSDDGRREECGVRADDRLLGRAQKESREVARRRRAGGYVPQPAGGGSPDEPPRADLSCK